MKDYKFKDKEHILFKTKMDNHNYYSDFEVCIDILRNKLGKKEFDDLINNKLLYDQLFLEKQFIQAAVEVTIVSYFAKQFPNSFKYEIKLNKDKNTDVDCQIEFNNRKYNIEVKCSDYESKESIDKKEGLKFDTVGRIPDFNDKFQEFKELIEKGSQFLEEKKEIFISKKMDNNMKDFLISAQTKFEENREDINLLFVACDNQNDCNKWYYTLYGNQGLFKEDSFHPTSSYNLVDAVVFSNLYFRHHNISSKKLSNCWDLNNAFLFVVPNKKALHIKKRGILEIKCLLHEHMFEIDKYIPLGNAPPYVKDTIRISSYIIEELENKKNIYYFNIP